MKEDKWIFCFMCAHNRWSYRRLAWLCGLTQKEIADVYKIRQCQNYEEVKSGKSKV